MLYHRGTGLKGLVPLNPLKGTLDSSIIYIPFLVKHFCLHRGGAKSAKIFSVSSVSYFCLPLCPLKGRKSINMGFLAKSHFVIKPSTILTSHYKLTSTNFSTPLFSSSPDIFRDQLQLQIHLGFRFRLQDFLTTHHSPLPSTLYPLPSTLYQLLNHRSFLQLLRRQSPRNKYLKQHQWKQK